MAVCDGDAGAERAADPVVEWNVLGAMSDGGRRWWWPSEFEWQLVSEWEPVDAVFDPATAWESYATERERSAGNGYSEREVPSNDELAGNDNQWHREPRWESHQLGQRD